MPLPKPGSDQESERARALLAAAIDGILSSVEEWGDRGRAVQVPLVVADDVESLCDTGGSYRDAVLVLLAFPAANETVYDITDRFHNDRSTSDWLGRFLRRRNIHSVASALQNSSFRHAFVHPKIRSEPLRNILLWASEPEREHEQIRRAFDRVARRTAETARQISQLPPLDATRLTYQRTLLLAEAMLEEPSEGACEQYTFAALKAAEIEAGDEGLRMVTKNVRASDAGRVAGDVQVVRGQAEVVEAYEVTAQPWEDKVAQAAEVWRQHGLHRVHIVAHAPDCRARDIETAVSGASLPTAIDPSRLDLSVLDLGHEIRSLVARLTKSGRRRFIEHLWDLLVEHHQDPHAERLVRHVEALGLTAPD